MKSLSFVKLLVFCAILGLVLSCVSVPHPNLVAAERFVRQAIDKVTDAQRANTYDMRGHAARAKELMRQAIDEINLAEQAAENR